MRARELGIALAGEPGRWNAITDVAGVEVGYETLISGSGSLVPGQGPVRTGVTAVLPLGRAQIGRSCPAGWYALNGNGEMTGTAWLDEVGALSLPIGLTSTHAIGPVHAGIIEWAIKANPGLASRWHMPVVAETWDGYLNDTNGSHVTQKTAIRALEAARSGPLAEGSVGGGTGMNCYGFKGGTGTASRQVSIGVKDGAGPGGGRGAKRAGPPGTPRYTVGVLMQANFGRRSELVIAGRRIGEELADDNPLENSDWVAPPGSGSCIVIVATDAPLLPGQCKALARRVPLGLARTGTSGSHFSGDLFLAFSTANVGMLDSAIDARGADDRLPRIEFVPWGRLDPLFEAVVQSVEEAVLNALVAARTMFGRDSHRSPGFPVERLAWLLSD